jgi:sugar-specific transcriptional regulator TrmB
MDEEILTKIGLTDSEKKVYLALLESGDSTRGQLVNKSKVAGSKIYDLLNKLQEKGLVSIYIKDKIKHFKSTNPNQILNYIEDKKNEFINLEKEAKTIIPALLNSFNSSKEEQEVQLITGLKGLQIIFREQLEILKSGESCYVIGGTKGIDEEVVQAFFEKIHLMREQKGIKTKMLYNLRQKTTVEKAYSSKNKFPLTTARYIEHSSPVAINIYKDLTIIIVFGKQITSIYIKSQEIADSFMSYFNILWKTSIK